MKKYLLLIILLSFFSLVYAENKVYVDTTKGLEVCDVSGIKTLEQINAEFKGNFQEVTAERKAKEETNKVIQAEKNKKEQLIQEKIREQAIVSLKTEGKLDNKGDLVK